MTENAYAYSIGPANPLPPLCENCEQPIYDDDFHELFNELHVACGNVRAFALQAEAETDEEDEQAPKSEPYFSAARDTRPLESR